MKFQSITKFFAISLFAFGLSGPALAVDGDANLEGLVDAADVVAGQALFRQCASCHTADEGGANRVGPNLYGIVDRQIGTVEGFRYSRAMAGSEDTWTLENLDAFLTSPRTARPGTSMSYAGVRNETHRMNLLNYLRSLRETE